MLRVVIMAALLLTVPATPAVSAVQDTAQGENQCADTPVKKAKRSIFGSVVGDLTGGILGRAGGLSSHLAPVSSIVTDELMKLLDCKEQRQAATATTEAIRGGVGTEVKWQSQSRQNVSGSSKVIGEQELADGRHCMTVTDVVIIDGEETTVPKRMCRGEDGGYQKA
jgi:surface antigen